MDRKLGVGPSATEAVATVPGGELSLPHLRVGDVVHDRGGIDATFQTVTHLTAAP